MATKISWCDETINPVVGCSKISAGCQNCYALKMAYRLRSMGKFPYTAATVGGLSVGVQRWDGHTYFSPEALDKPYKWRKPRSVFIGSMGDVFHDTAPFAWIERILGMVASNPQHTFIMLTKRAGRMREFFQTTGMAGQLACMYQLAAGTNPETCQVDNWPLPNLVLGVSVEDQQTADDRIPVLLQIPAAKRFVSLEPMVGPVDLGRVDWPYGYGMYKVLNALTGQEHTGSGLNCNKHANNPHLDGVILGGESGRNGRRLDPLWVMSVRDQCAAAGVPFMFKQWDHENRNDIDLDNGFPWLGNRTHSELAW